MAGFPYLTDPDGGVVLYTSKQLIDGYAVGGVLSGTLPNPSLVVYPTTLLDYNPSTDVVNGAILNAGAWTTIITDQNFTVTNANAPLDIKITLGFTITCSGITVGTPLQFACRFQIDDTTNYFISSGSSIDAVANDLIVYLNGSAVNIGTLSIATHTIRIQAIVSRSSAGNIRASSQSNYEFIRIQVIQNI